MEVAEVGVHELEVKEFVISVEESLICPEPPAKGGSFSDSGALNVNTNS